MARSPFGPRLHALGPRALALLTTALLSVEAVSAQAPILTEFLARNEATLDDEDGEPSDWIEVHNPSAAPIDLDGWCLTDDAADLTKWTFPGEVVPPGGYLLVFASGKDRSVPGAPLHTNFRLASGGEYLALLDPAGNAATEYAPEYPQQSTDVSFGLEQDLVTLAFFPTPTPGAPNGGGNGASLDPVSFSRPRGMETESFALELSHPRPSASIHVTLDGREPSTLDPVYTGAFVVDRTSTIRARAFEAGWLPSPVASRTWVFPEQTASQDLATALARRLPPEWIDRYGDNWDRGGTRPGSWYGLDHLVMAPYTPAQVVEALTALPTVSVQMHPDDLFGFMAPSGRVGIYANSRQEGADWERACSLEWIEPSDGSGFQIDCGVSIQGGTNTGLNNRSQLSLALKFKSAYGPSKLEYEVFPDSSVDRFDYLILDCSSQLSISGPAGSSTKIHAQETRDEFASDLQQEMGNLSPHGRWVHLYLNGLYWGVLHLHERPDERFAAEYGGGADEEYDWVKRGSVDAGNDASVGSATPGLWREVRDIVDAGVAPGATWQGEDAYGALASRVDLVNYVDYLLVNWYCGNTDWPQNNWMATAHARNSGDPADVNREGRFRFHNWDAEATLYWGGAATAVGDGFWDRTGITSTNFTNAAFIHTAALAHPAYRMLLADRAHRHLLTPGGALWVEPGFDVMGTPFDPAFPERNVPASRYHGLAAELGPAVLMEYARWGNYFHSPGRFNLTDWVAERDRLLEDFFPIRSQVLVQQLRAATPQLLPDLAAPIPSRSPGRYRAGTTLDVSAAGGATVYFTLDGSDPRLPLGGISPTATAATGPIALPRGTSRLLARAFDGTEWSPPASGTYCVGVRVRINEVQSDNRGTIADPAGDFEDWIELRNLTDAPIDLSGFHLTDDAERPDRYRIPEGVTIPAKGHLLFWADDDSGEGPEHLNFRLDSAGEFVGLFGPDELSSIPVDQVEVPALRENHSYARERDGRGGFNRSANPTPGAANAPGDRAPR